MIVASLLLILVAVILLVLGLAGGSSTLLISSIVASLLAAVALVIGARQNTARTTAARGEPLLADDPDPSPAAAFTHPVSAGAATSPANARWGARRRRAAVAEDRLDAPTSVIPGIDDFPPPPPPASGADAGAREDDATATGGTYTTAAQADAAAAEAASVPHDPFDNEPDQAVAYAAGQRDTEASLPPPAPEADVTGRAHPDAPPHTESPAGADRSPYSGTEATRPGRRSAGSPDYDQAASVIGGARTQEDTSWRRDGSGTGADPAPATRADDPSAGGPSVGGPVAGDPAAGGPVVGGPVAGGAGDARNAEYGDPDPADPDDEPLPQAVRPADAVRVARLDAEVVVMDGRPRYHLATCPFVAGKETEALPVAEAVELGFSPCGTCRPVDALMAAATRR
ncbi:hypothetical protein [Actinoplanes sp. N902-109]|uniref:hypothetical protein n=1 Tax=Actinoplanes sp. (strain N902-109) TaxID=649831 RepID=UPI0003295A33|nr:hypothetical protein [Actinoplanes sp. N902-109]AGL15537.1 hypothetical protein L083_2027 [Actinoplanes sp. N902-109]